MRQSVIFKLHNTESKNQIMMKQFYQLKLLLSRVFETRDSKSQVCDLLYHFCRHKSPFWHSFLLHSMQCKIWKGKSRGCFFCHWKPISLIKMKWWFAVYLRARKWIKHSLGTWPTVNPVLKPKVFSCLSSWHSNLRDHLTHCLDRRQPDSWE